MIGLVIQHRAYRLQANLWYELVHCLAHNGPFRGGVGTSSNPNAVKSFKPAAGQVVLTSDRDFVLAIQT